MLARDGQTALTVRRLAQELGTSTMPLYSYFSGKDEFVAAIVEEGLARLASRAEDMAPHDDPLQHMLRMAHVYRDHALEFPDLYAVTFRTKALAYFDETGGLGRFAAILVARCHDMITRWDLQGRDAHSIALLLIANAHGHVSLELSGLFPSGSGRAAYEAMFATTFIGLGVDPKAVKAATKAVSD